MNKRAESQDVRGRYRALVGFIAVFVISIISVLSLNFIVSSQFEDDAVEINLAGQQRMLSQRIVKSLQNILLAQKRGDEVESHLAELRQTFDQFDITLYAFDSGGAIRDSHDQLVSLNAVTVPDGRSAVEETKLIWKDYRLAIQGILKADETVLQSIADATHSLESHSGALLSSLTVIQQNLSTTERDSGHGERLASLALISQQIVNTMFGIEQASLKNSSITRPIEQLQSLILAFDENLDALQQVAEPAQTDQAGQSDGSPEPVESGSQSTANTETGGLLTAEQIDAIETEWRPIRESLDPVLTAEIDGLISLSQAINFATKNNLKLLTLMDALAAALEQDATQRSDRLRLIQVIGIAFALVMFGIIVFYFLTQLRRTDDQLNQARQETDRILDTVNDGLFLMDGEHVIGNQYSGSLVNILNVEEPAGENFLSLLKRIVPEKTLKTAEDYIELLLGDRVNEELVTDLNPLDEIEVFFDSGEGEHLARHLSFGFKRVIVDDRISHLLVKVDDVTDRVTLERDLQLSQQKSQAQFDLMIQVLHVEPPMLTRFLSGSERSLGTINEILSERSITPKQHRSKVERIYRLAHSIKGDASSLGLDLFEQKAHDFEDILEDLQERDQITGKDFLPLTIKLDDFLNQIESLRALIQRLGQLQRTVNPTDKVVPPVPNETAVPEPSPAPAIGGQFQAMLGQLATRVANDQGKQVSLQIDGEALIPDKYKRECNDILIQLIRNSVVHGIEDAQTRRSNNKPDIGQLTVSVTRTGDNYIQIAYRDDGRGLSSAAIKQAALDKGLITQAQLKSLLPKHIVGLIFKPGISTLGTADKHAGRGVGMDVVASTVKSIGGMIGVKSVAGMFCEFLIRLPSPDVSSQIEREAV